MHAGFDGEARQLEIEVVGNRAHHRVAFTHDGAGRRRIADVEPRGNQPLSGIRGEKLGKMVHVQVGDPHLGDIGILQEIVGAGRALQPTPQNEHAHMVAYSR